MLDFHISTNTYLVILHTTKSVILMGKDEEPKTHFDEKINKISNLFWSPCFMAITHF